MQNDKCAVCIYRYWCRDMQIIAPPDCDAFTLDRGLIKAREQIHERLL